MEDKETIIINSRLGIVTVNNKIAIIKEQLIDTLKPDVVLLTKEEAIQIISALKQFTKEKKIENV